MNLTAPLSLGCFFLLASCTIDGTEMPQAVSDDSASTLTEVRRLDGVELELVPIGDALLASSGAIVFTQPIDDAIRIFPTSGQPLTRGGEGRGPGQFTGIGRTAWRADSLVVQDDAQGRLTLFTPGNYLPARTFRYPASATLEEGPRDETQTFPGVSTMALAPGDTVVAELTASAGRNAVLARIGSDGRVSRVLASIPKHGSVALPSGGTMALPFTNLVHSAVSPEGTWIAIAAVDRSDVPTMGTLRVTLIDAQSGDTAYVAERDLALEPISRAFADSFVTRHAKLLAERSPEMAGVLEREGLPDYFPPIQWLLVTDEGRAYVEVRDSGSERRYLVFDRDGSFLGRLLVPNSGRIHSADGSSILAVETNALDVPSLVEYEVSWERP